MLEILIPKGSLSETIPFLSRVKNDGEFEKILRIGQTKEKAIAVILSEAKKSETIKRKYSQLITTIFNTKEEEKCFVDILHILRGDDIIYLQNKNIYFTDSKHCERVKKSEDYLYTLCGLI